METGDLVKELERRGWYVSSSMCFYKGDQTLSIFFMTDSIYVITWKKVDGKRKKVKATFKLDCIDKILKFAEEG